MAPRFELRNRKDTGKAIDPVWLWSRSPHGQPAAHTMRTSEPPHGRRGMNLPQGRAAVENDPKLLIRGRCKCIIIALREVRKWKGHEKEAGCRCERELPPARRSL